MTVQTVVADVGSGFMKTGLAGDTFPRAIFPCVVGRAAGAAAAAALEAEGREHLVGTECLGAAGRSRAAQSSLALSHPISNGIVRQWEDMRLVFEHTWKDVLRVDPRDCQVMLTDPPMNPSENRRRMLEEMFETHGFQRAFIQVQAVLTLYSQGLLSGLVLDSGDGVTHAVPVVEGYSSPHLIRRLDVAGRHLTAHLAGLLAQRGYAVSTAADFATVQKAKEQLCYVALDTKAEARLARETTACVRQYTLPDGRVITVGVGGTQTPQCMSFPKVLLAWSQTGRAVTVGAERYQAPEALFDPSLLGVEAPGVAELVHGCIADSAIDNRLALYSHIVLSGGTTLLPGFGARLDKELRRLYLDKVLKGRTEGLAKLKLRVEDPPRRRVAVFMGASILASIMADSPELWVSREEWAEDPGRALQKCAGALSR